MKTIALSVALITFLLWGTVLASPAGAQSSLHDRERFVAIAKTLERDPMNPALRAERAWAVQWLVDAPDIIVSACLSVIGGVSDKSFDQASEITVQYPIAMGAFLVANPAARNDEDAVQMAGVESVLATYQAIRVAKPATRSAELETLLAIQRRGKLREVTQAAYRSCMAKGGTDHIEASSPPSATQWEQIWDQPAVAVIYADRSTITGSKTLRSITTRTVYRDPRPEGDIAERIRIEEFDCARHRSRLRRSLIISRNGQRAEPIEWAPGKSPWRNHEPDSLGGKKTKIACNLE